MRLLMGAALMMLVGDVVRIVVATAMFVVAPFFVATALRLTTVSININFRIWLVRLDCSRVGTGSFRCAFFEVVEESMVLGPALETPFSTAALILHVRVR